MSYAFISALKKNPAQSYQSLLQNIRNELQGKYAQKPQLSCSHPLGTNEYSFADTSAPFMPNDTQPYDDTQMEYQY